MAPGRRRCTFCDENGRRCDRAASEFPLYCAFHSNVLYNVVVKKSGIPGAGMGLWVGDRAIEKNGLIACYGTDRIPKQRASVAEAKGRTEYLFCEGAWCWDARRKDSSIVRFANDAHGTAHKTNAVFVMRGGVPWIKATRRIPPGSEIFADYGPDYWG